MSFLDFESLPMLLNFGVFALAAAAVWFVGTRAAYYADAISARTGLGKAFMGLLILALATSTPELGTTITASLDGNANLALNNIFGGITFQTVILAIVDLMLIRGALTFFSPRPVLLLQGVLLIVLLALTLAAIAARDVVSIAGVGLWSIVLLIGYLAALYLSHKYEGNEEWEAKHEPSEDESRNAIRAEEVDTQKEYENWSTRRLILLFAGGTAVIFGAGVLLSTVADAIATQSGLGTSFVGATLLAAATSLPELSTTTAAIRVGNYQMAFSNIFGSNSILILFLFVSDLFYAGDPIINEVGAAGIFNAAMGIIVTGIYLVGLIERQNRTVFRVGLDSAFVMAAYLISVVVLFTLR